VFEEDRRRERLRKLHQPFQRRSLLVQFGLFLLVLILWKIPIFNPIKLVVVLIHEFSHVAAAYLTGGVVFGLAIDPGGAGVTLGMGGHEVLIVSAGYVGSLLFGIFLYWLSAVWKADEVWGILTLCSCASMAFGWLNDFTFLFGYGTITLMFLGMFKLDEKVQRFLLRWVATTCCLYPILDVAGEWYQTTAQGFVVQGQVTGSDVRQLAELLGISEALIASVWVFLGIVTVPLLICWTAQRDAETEIKRTFFHNRRLTPILYPKYDPDRPQDLPRYVID
jgi:hypothetical protein